jgi:hypothetical protein
MPSFSKTSTWNVGYFRGISSWVLRNRRDVTSRIDAINTELARIGRVTVVYKTGKDELGNILVTEERIGFSVTKNSSLEKLFQAYIAQGGNPFDVSMFLYPDSTVVDTDEDDNPIVKPRYPHGGVAAPKSVSYVDPVGEEGATGFEGYQGGFMEMDRYFPARQGSRRDRGSRDDESVVRTVQTMRLWANQDIKERLQDIEWRIIKLADLAEQLTRERDEVLVEAFGGAMDVLVDDFDPDLHLQSLRVQSLVEGMWDLIYLAGVELEEFQLDPDPENLHDAPRSTSPEETNVGGLEFTFENVQSEDLLDLG